MSEVRGTALLSTRFWVVQQHGEEAWKRDLEAYRAATNREFPAVLLPIQFYPVRTLVDVTAVVDRAHGTGNGALARTIAAESARRDMSTIFRTFISLGSPLLTARMSKRIWSQYYTAGALEAEKVGPGAMRVIILGFDEPNPILCQRWLGWMEVAFNVSLKTRGRGVVKKVGCSLSGDEGCRYTFEW